MKYYENALDDEVFQIILATCTSVDLLALSDPLRFRQRVRTISGNIYDMSAIPSGLISWDCVQALRCKKQKNVTKEHFYGRKEGGEEIVNYVKESLTSGQPVNPMIVKEIVDKHRQVHYTSKEENVRLAAIVKRNPTLKNDWRKMYEAAGVTLIPYVKRQRYKHYCLQ